jgi:hypothetical protein
MNKVLWWIAFMTLLHSAQTTHQGDTKMHVEFFQSGDSCVVTSSKIGDVRRTTLEVRSERGIGNCKVDRKADKWAEELTLRLHLRGLEQIVVHVEDRKWIGSVSSSEGIVRWSHQAKDAMEKPVDSSDPNWCSVRVARLHESTEGEKTQPSPTHPSQTQAKFAREIRVPLEDGECWEITIPEIWLKENPASIRISWIDFFR